MGVAIDWARATHVHAPTYDHAHDIQLSSKLVLTRKNEVFQMNSYTVETVVRGYRVYPAIWEAAVGQVLPCQKECGNVHNPYTVAIVNRSVIVDHVPWAISSVCYLILGRDSTITCQVTAARHYSADLPQGGLEVPCKLIYFLAKLGWLSKCKNFSKKLSILAFSPHVTWTATLN